jgi:alkylation response protein AidB-like acyl-CoA dehydrogenase
MAARSDSPGEPGHTAASPLAVKAARLSARSHPAGSGGRVTWEHDAHLYYKRAMSTEPLFGSPAVHRARLADRLGV